MPDTTISTSSTNFNKALTTLVIKTLEQELRPTLPWVRECTPAKFVAGTDNTMRFLRAEDMAVVTGTPTPGVSPWLEEGVTPDGEDLDFGYEEFQAAQAGRLLKLTDVATERWIGDLTSLATEKVTVNAAQTADQRVADVVVAGTNRVYAGVGNTAPDDVAIGDVVDGRLLRRVVAVMKTDLIPTFGDGYFHAILSPGIVFDIESDDAVGGWIEANKYAGTMALMTGEIGRYAGIRFIESTRAGVLTGQGTSSNGPTDVFVTTVFGPGAFVFGDWETIQVFYTAPGGKGDELHQRAAVGWKANYGAKLLEEVAPRYTNILSSSGL